jgi:superfamily II DNA or RNA helicase
MNILTPSPTQKLASPQSEKQTTSYKFQQEAIREVYSLIKNNIQRILFCSPCGSGKTRMASQIIFDATVRAKKPLKVVFLVSLNCLIDQSLESFAEMGITDVSVLQGDRSFNLDASVIIASIQTITSRAKKQSIREVLGNPGLIFSDECHWLCYQKTYALIQETYTNSSTIFIGLTATPYRTKSSQHLGQWFDEVVVAAQPPDLIKQGILVPCRIFGFGKSFDYTKIDIGHDGDYNISQIEAQATNKVNSKFFVEQYKKLASNRKTVAFCATVNHAKVLCEDFNSAGVVAEFLAAETPKEVRSQIFDRLKNGDTMVICSVGTLNAGWNCPIVSCVMVVRPTTSTALFYQMGGRGSRRFPGKENYLILDFGNNAVRHGSPMSYREIDISPKVYPRKKVASLKECPHCSSVIPIFARVCPECGEVLAKPPEKEEEQYTVPPDDLVEILLPEDRIKLKRFRSKKKESFKNKTSYREAENWFLAEYGYLPPKEWNLHAILGKRFSAKKKQEFEDWIRSFAKHEYEFKVRCRDEYGFDFDGTSKKQKQPQGIHEFEGKSWREILGVSYNPSFLEVKQTYIELVKLYHPDTSKDPNALEKMKVINNAWDKFLQIYGR